MKLVFTLLGGLALFIYGMQVMGDGLQKSAGNRMRSILEVLTSIPLVGVLVGTIVTAIIQSSSATTVMVVGFVNAGLMTLKQAVSVIMGANIGTTVTAQLIAFKLSHYIEPLIALGFAFYFFGRKRTHRYIGQVVLGFGILFLGLDIMKDAMAPLREYEGFRIFMANFGRYPLLGVAVGIVMTSLIQSSSATIGILIAMASQGLVSLEAAIPILLGDNIGTCITALLASIGTNLTARRAAFSHVLFNVTGTVIFLLFMPLFLKLVLIISPQDDIARQIANAHTSFNVLNTLLFLPIINIFVKGIIKLIPGEVETIPQGPVYLDPRMLKTPAIALSLATKEIIRMADIAYRNVADAMEGFFQEDAKLLNSVFEREKVIDQLDEAITAYLAQIAQRGMNPALSKRHTGLLHAVNDLERVGDHAVNIAQMAFNRIEDGLPFTEQALSELQEMSELVKDTLAQAIEALKHDNVSAAKQVLRQERKIDEMEKSLRLSHIGRLNCGKCYPGSGVVFLDIISNLERVGDHSHNIAQVVLEED
ncbi:Na/Pi cotransporter family protein [Calderihabitans maritimus]|uniref:II-like Na/Pi co-transporter n=1 Tax=Calderihabitans maritimus TaxID=1246530 RepID=A0A1Z5HPU5_9FIRM|nr:Na/Pi cotransporter family protein [Calderihabitans maritimus]GAW91549.1 II-like Na/Pi co-transporter [Calderihabitans maritimus]